MKITLLIFLVTLMLNVAGCFPLSSSLSNETIVASRNLQDSDVQNIIFQEWRTEYFFLLGHDGLFRIGGILDYKYIFTQGRHKKSLSFLKPEWEKYLQQLQGPIPIKNTENWLGIYAFSSLDQGVIVEVLLFTPQKLIARHTIHNVICQYRMDHILDDYSTGIRKGETEIVFPSYNGDYVLNCMSGTLSIR